MFVAVGGSVVVVPTYTAVADPRYRPVFPADALPVPATVCCYHRDSNDSVFIATHICSLDFVITHVLFHRTLTYDVIVAVPLTVVVAA